MSAVQIRKGSAALKSSQQQQPVNQKSQQTAVAKKQQSFRIAYAIQEGTKTSSKAGFENVNLHDAINTLVYGEKIIKYSRNGSRKHTNFFYLHESDNSTLQWLSHQKKYTDARIKLSSIKNISSEPHALKISHLNLSVSLCLFLEGGKELVLEFHDSHVRDLWWKGLIFLREYWRDLDLNNLITREQMVEKMLKGTVAIDTKKKFGEQEIKEILKKLLISIRGEDYEQKASSFYKNKEKMLSYDDLVTLLLQLLEKQEIQPIFKKYSINDQMILYKEVQRFFADEQGEDLDEKLVLARMNRLIKGTEHKIVNYLSFCQLIFTSENSIFDPQKLASIASFERPLSDYFVHSSFRSYLAYDIATFNTDPTRGYVYLLQKGVRQFDLFCIDGEKGEPEVKQGAAQSIKASFSDILKTVKATAFERSPHPVIIDLDHECSLQQQERMAEIIAAILGDLLYKLPEDFLGFKYLPSPEQLKKKIVLRAKGRLANIISMYEKSVSKRARQKEVKELENKKNKLIQQEDHSGNVLYDVNAEQRGIVNIHKKSKTYEDEGKRDQEYYSEEGEEDEEYEEYDDHGKQRIKSKAKTNKRGENSSNKKRRLQQQHTTAKELSSTGKSIASGYNNSSYKAGSGGKGESEIEQLIDLELNLDKEFLNDDNYAVAKTSQITLFNFQQNKTIVTANREYKSMITMQQNSQYSLVENPKEALQRKMRSDQQQYSFFEAKSPSLKSQQSNKQRRHTSRSSSFKQLPHLEIAFKSDVPIHEYHGSQSNVALVGKEDSDSPAYSKHPNPADKKRQSLLYLARKRASIENIQPMGSFLSNNNNNNNQANDPSQREILQNLQNGSFYMQDSKKQGVHSSSSSDAADEMLSQAIFLDNSKATGANGEEFLPQNSGLVNGNNNLNADSQSQRYGIQEGGGLSIMQSSLFQPESKNFMIGSKQKIVAKSSQFANIANSLEKCTALFACKYKQQQELSIWSCSQLSDQKVAAVVQKTMLDVVDDISFNLLQHTRQYLLRIKPKFLNNNKGDQQNIDFIQAFCAGCQFSGQNYAIYDHFLLAYSQFFRQNASSGLILKPPWLLSDSHCDGAAFYEKEAQRPKLWVKIEVISAMSLRVPTDEEKKIVPWIAIRLIGTPIDLKANNTAFTSSDSPSSSFNPQFDSLISDFTVHLPQFAFIYFQIFESQENPIQFAQYVIPVSCIRKGFRTVPLLDAQHKIIPNSFLFVHVTIEELTQQQDISILNPNRQQNVSISTHEAIKTPPPRPASISIKNISSNQIIL